MDCSRLKVIDAELCNRRHNFPRCLWISCKPFSFDVKPNGAFSSDMSSLGETAWEVVIQPHNQVSSNSCPKIDSDCPNVITYVDKRYNTALKQIAALNGPFSGDCNEFEHNISFS
ncbi:unnamed protein product [Nezara viridula]|uniref:Uncharacterized protein n=1 Tax=Nezara viridula TaxID=85310 RepID=A0A9P0E9Y2_NEZVI|nr:unnamed protein product [Nezara viridula]